MNWTIGRTFAAVVVMAVASTVFIGAFATYTLSNVVDDKDVVIDVDGKNTIDVMFLEHNTEAMRADFALHVLGDKSAAGSETTERKELHQRIDDLRVALDDRAALTALDDVDRAALDVERVTDGLDERLPLMTPEERMAAIEAEVLPKFDELDRTINVLEPLQHRIMDDHASVASGKADRATVFLLAVSALSSLAFALIAWWMASSLTRRVTEAVQHVQSASAELQAAATQTASATKEQISTVTEIANTFRELQSTTRQIADGAQRVAGIAVQTSQSSEEGLSTVHRGRDAVGNIKHEVEVIVHHMLDLGRKSQQIGGILEMINELAEQTNILAINASIEAAGAGEAGARFGVVAEEIRKLADRVGGSTKDIRTLIDEIRASVNTTVMATETGSKAVDVGVAKFGDVTAVFGAIGKGVGIVSEAAREIELGTRQQTTAVDQVGQALAGLQQVARETESATTQTAQTAQQLSGLSRDLTQLVSPRGQ